MRLSFFVHFISFTFQSTKAKHCHSNQFECKREQCFDARKKCGKNFDGTRLLKIDENCFILNDLLYILSH